MRKIFGIGLIIRLLMMPFLAHPDLLLTYGRSWEIAFEGAGLFRFGQPIPHIIQSLWLQIIGVFTGSEFFLPLQTALGDAKNYDLMAQFTADNSAPNLTIFLFKLLYLGIDILVFYIIYKFWKEKDIKVKNFMLSFYWLNPILIFAVYAFGRYEVIPAVFILLILMSLKQLEEVKGELWASLFFGLLIAARPSLIMLLPIFLILAGRKFWLKGVSLVIALLPYALSVLLQKLQTPVLAGSSQQALAITSGSHFQYVIDGGLQINEVFQIQISVFVVIYALIAYAAFKMWQQGKNNWAYHSLFYSLALLAFFGSSFYHPHYLAWLVVPLAVTVTYFKLWNKLKLLLWGGVLVFPFLLLTWGKDILMGIFIPLSVELGSKDLAGVFAHVIDPINLNSIVWSLMSAIFFLVAWQLWKAGDLKFFYEN